MEQSVHLLTIKLTGFFLEQYMTKKSLDKVLQT